MKWRDYETYMRTVIRLVLESLSDPALDVKIEVSMVCLVVVCCDLVVLWWLFVGRW